MSQASHNARIKVEGRKRRERSAAAAVCWSVLTAVAGAMVIFCVEIATPGTALHNFWQLVYVNGQVSPSSPLLQSLRDQVVREDTLFVTPLCLLCAGIVLGRLVPNTLSRKRLLTAAGAVPVGVVLLCLAFFWGIILTAQHGRLSTGQLDAPMIQSQTLSTVGWIIAYVVGTFLGVIWRDLRRKRETDASAHSPSPVTSR